MSWDNQRPMSSPVQYRLEAARTLLATRMFKVERPDKSIRALGALRRWGSNAAAAYTVSAIRCPDRIALVDERGTLTFAEIARRTDALAHGLAAAGVREGDGVAIMCRNHRGFVEATVACAKLGASQLYLNTAFAGPQITDVLRREAPTALIYDEEFADLVSAGSEGMHRFIAWSETAAERDAARRAGGEDDAGSGPRSALAGADPRLEDLIERGDPTPLEPPAEHGRVVILTSGTTGTPKGAKRKQPDSMEPLAAMFSKIPLRAHESTVIAAPMFHSWGYGHFTLAMPLASTLVLPRR
jgi:acyl-CoA synthetase (AMP-forming)/AMP-acid ligase II